MKVTKPDIRLRMFLAFWLLHFVTKVLISTGNLCNNKFGFKISRFSYVVIANLHEKFRKTFSIIIST